MPKPTTPPPPETIWCPTCRERTTYWVQPATRRIGCVECGVEQFGTALPGMIATYRDAVAGWEALRSWMEAVCPPPPPPPDPGPEAANPEPE